MEKRSIRVGINNLIKLVLFVKYNFPGIEKCIIQDNLCILIIDKKWLKVVVRMLKSVLNLHLDALLDIWCTDYPNNIKRFEISYMFVSYLFNYRIILRVFVKENESIETVSDLFGSAGWLEREIWDMFGVFFKNNKDLRRILTDYGFEGFPLRKDFPMTGFVEIRYDDTEKRLVQELIEVAQDYRVFNFKSPWEKL